MAWIKTDKFDFETGKKVSHSKEFREKKDKILDKIFVSPQEHIKILEKENLLLREKSKLKTSDILVAIGSIMRTHEMDFRESIQGNGSPETVKYSLSLWEKIEKHLYNELYPDLKKVIDLQRKKLADTKAEYDWKVQEEEERLLELKKLKKQKKKKVTEISKRIKEIVD